MHREAQPRQSLGVILKQDLDSGLQSPQPWSGPAPHAATGRVLMEAQVWGQRKADRTRHALASYLVSFFFLIRVNIF